MEKENENKNQFKNKKKYFKFLKFVKLKNVLKIITKNKVYITNLKLKVVEKIKKIFEKINI